MREHAVSESGDRRSSSAAVLQRVSAMVFGDGARRYCIRCHHKCKAGSAPISTPKPGNG